MSTINTSENDRLIRLEYSFFDSFSTKIHSKKRLARAFRLKHCLDSLKRAMRARNAYKAAGGYIEMISIMNSHILDLQDVTAALEKTMSPDQVQSVKSGNIREQLKPKSRRSAKTVDTNS